MDIQQPKTLRGQQLRDRLKPERWERVVSDALARAKVVAAVLKLQADTQQPWRHCVQEAGAHWSNWRRWKQRYDAGEGETWERLLDERVPPTGKIAEHVRSAARSLRRSNRSINGDEAREHLVAEFQDEGNVSDAWLKRVWAEAGLTWISKNKPTPPVEEEVEQFHGGGGLALLTAANAELQVLERLASHTRDAGLERAAAGGDTGALSDAEGRDDQGRFTATYNERHRQGVPAGQADGRWRPDQAKALERNLGSLPTLSQKKATLARKMFAMGVTPLLTERRGFDGLDGPAGQWLGVLGGHEYMPATLDKCLAELGLLDVGPAMWQTHAQQWSSITGGWSSPGPGWLQTVLYVDATTDPHWTRSFALSGKVSRVGRVMPCLTRIAVHSGAGAPLLVETHAGTAKLKQRLLPMLRELHRAIGADGEVERLTVVDSEAGNASMILALNNDAEVFLVTVVKGQVLKNAPIRNEGPWVRFRQRDELREAELLLKGADAPPEGVWIRCVQMRRADSRTERLTHFVSNATVEDVGTVQVAELYLSRWPLQEQCFRNGRNGGGLNRSHGYGRAEVSHVALEGKLDKAKRQVGRAKVRQERAHETRDELATALEEAPASTRRKALALVDKEVRQHEREQHKHEGRQARLETTPRTILARDTGRDSIMTCLKLSIMLLIEYALHEYFGDVRMEWRTFIEQFVALPVTVRHSKRRRLFQIHANRRQPKHMEKLAAALEVINGRGIQVGEQRLVFELIGGKAAGP